MENIQVSGLDDDEIENIDKFSWQFYTDGGLRGSHGAAAYILYAIPRHKCTEPIIMEVSAVFMEQQYSAFVMELVGADLAVDRAMSLSKLLQPNILTGAIRLPGTSKRLKLSFGGIEILHD